MTEAPLLHQGWVLVAFSSLSSAGSEQASESSYSLEECASPKESLDVSQAWLLVHNTLAGLVFIPLQSRS